MNNSAARKADCFAYRADDDRCTALTELQCASCPFYKSHEQFRMECLRVSLRLNDKNLAAKGGAAS